MKYSIRLLAPASFRRAAARPPRAGPPHRPASSGRTRRRSGALDPGGAVGVVLLLPDRHDLLETFDDERAGGERLVSVPGRNRDDDADLSDIEEADPVDNGDVRRAEARFRFAADFAHHRL